MPPGDRLPGRRRPNVVPCKGEPSVLPILAERLAERVDAVIGVDTHTDTHTAVVLTPVGTVLTEITVPATDDGAAVLLAWAGRQTTGLGTGRRAWALDGARCHGVGLLRVLRAAGEDVLEAPKPAAGRRRRGGKSDVLDAVHAARGVLAADHVAAPRADGDREALRLLLVCRRHYSDTRTATINLFKSVILTADDDLRSQMRGLSTLRQVHHATTLTTTTTSGSGSGLDRLRRTQLAALAEQILILERLLKANLTEIRTMVDKLCPTLLDQPGIGPVTAAIALTAWSHPGRFRNEAAFASLAGVSPIPASSGRITRHRLNRGGDRTLNAALHTIAKARQRCHQPTKDYINRRTTEGRTPAEITRSLKRYIARQIWRTLETTA
ncbi:IS110 family transposase [Micromonospora sp. WMMD998]|uniref:IS110 family transposase n=1 Tax=Micromonospora sp. WMMD998 TaxID=3016092 RepID=UPI00249A8220|nr:IS110 family transposase [Micromonospora sp. WMMD998]WFE40679.1 IS110 family transposase [Micromonospora sp. WMMD998]WFE42142.1 IS110 family transposase [Micromonospora sp. WMMD998]